MKTQYAVCHLERGKGNDSGMSCHIERQKANGESHIPDNADASRTHLNRELITFPEGVTNRTQAIQHRLANAGLSRKVAKNACQCVRIILSGTHERMMELAEQGRIDDWCKDNIDWLKRTFGDDNLVSCVLHMDEKTPHLHATIVPIVNKKRERRAREGERKYKEKPDGPRLCASDVLKRGLLRQYQTTYGKAMSVYGLERGVIASTAYHKTQQEFLREQTLSMQEDIVKLQAEIDELRSMKGTLEKEAHDGMSRIFAIFGKGDIPKLKKEIEEKERLITKLKSQLASAVKQLNEEKAGRQRDKSAFQTEIDNAIKRATTAESKNKALEERNEKLSEANRSLHRKAYPERYRLSSGAELLECYIPNRRNPHLSIITKFHGEEYKTAYYNLPEDVMQKIDKGVLTAHEAVNKLFSPWEQVHESQHELLAIALQTAAGGIPNAHVGTGGGGSSSDLPWRDKNSDQFRKSNSRRGR